MTDSKNHIIYKAKLYRNAQQKRRTMKKYIIYKAAQNVDELRRFVVV